MFIQDLNCINMYEEKDIIEAVNLLFETKEQGEERVFT